MMCFIVNDITRFSRYISNEWKAKKGESYPKAVQDYVINALLNMKMVQCSVSYLTNLIEIIVVMIK